jgi:hypothetical protein
LVDIIHNIFEDDFNKNLTHTYDLSFLIGKDRLSYLISNQQQQILALRAYKFSDSPSEKSLKQLLIEDSIVRQKFRTVRVGIFSPRFSLIPLSLFKESGASNYLEQTTNLQRNDKVLSDTISSLKAANVYAFDEQYIRGLAEHYPEARFFHASTGLINNFIANYDSSSSKQIFLNIYNQYVTITVIENAQLLFHNIFSFKASPDCLYYILLVYKQLGMTPHKYPLHIIGELVADSEIYKLLYKYIKTIHFVNRPNFYVFGEKLRDSFPQNFFFDLYSLKLCE